MYLKVTSSFWAYCLQRCVMDITKQNFNCLRGPPHPSSCSRLCSQLYFNIPSEKMWTASHSLPFKTYFQHSKSFCLIGHSLYIRKANPQYFEHVTKNYSVDWTDLTQDTDKWPALLYTGINFWCHRTCGILWWAEELSASEEGLCCMQLVNFRKNCIHDIKYRPQWDLHMYLQYFCMPDI